MTRITCDENHPEGNCLQAAVASILSLPVHEVPDFSRVKDTDRYDNHAWFEDMAEWAAERGLGVVHAWKQRFPELYNTLVVAIGHRTAREPEKHAVILKASTVGTKLTFCKVHDPNPTNKFLHTITELFFFVPQGVSA